MIDSAQAQQSEIGIPMNFLPPIFVSHSKGSQSPFVLEKDFSGFIIKQFIWKSKRTVHGKIHFIRILKFSSSKLQFSEFNEHLHNFTSEWKPDKCAFLNWTDSFITFILWLWFDSIFEYNINKCKLFYGFHNYNISKDANRNKGNCNLRIFSSFQPKLFRFYSEINLRSGSWRTILTNFL